MRVINGVAFWMLMACGGADDAADTGAPDTDTGAPPDTDTEVIDTDVDTDTSPDTDTGEIDTGPNDDAAYASLFDASIVQRIDLVLSPEAIQALRADPDTYVEGGFEHDGYVYDDVGIKLTGGDSTFEDIDGKPSFRIRMDEFDDNQDYGGLTRINLHNMKDDPSQVREVVGAAIWEAAGLVAARASFAEVWVNGESYGLYANVEELDQAFLDRHYTDASGDLWDADDGADLTGDLVDNYASAAGEGDLEALDDARLQVQTGAGPFYEAADRVVDMAQFFDFWSWQILTGNGDGYPYELDDHALYANPASRGRYQWIPTGLDDTFDNGMEWDAFTGTMAVHCFYDADCLVQFDVALEEAIDLWEDIDATTLAGDAMTVSETTMQFDTRRGSTIGEVTAAQTQLLTTLTTRAATVRTQAGM